MSLRYLASLAALGAAFGLAPAPVAGQIHDVRDLNVDQIRSLDREKTVVMLQGGIIEEHGPYLPVYSDGFLSEYLAAELAKAIVARPGWKVVFFPVIPLGSGGANEIGRKYSFPGTFAARPETLRAVYMDLATGEGRNNRWSNSQRPFDLVHVDSGFFGGGTYSFSINSIRGRPMGLPSAFACC